MNVKKIITGGLIVAAVIAGPLLGAQDAQAPQAPVVTIDPNRHGNLAAAQGDIVDAYQRIDMAQSANNDQLGGHAQKAKDFLSQANMELSLAADFANARQDAQQQQPEPGPDNASGNWTIYAQNIDQPGGSTKFVQIQQFGNQLSGHFKGPHQSGGIEGFVNVHHIEFSTHTHDPQALSRESSELIVYATPAGKRGLTSL
jgi:hypothetical protein